MALPNRKGLQQRKIQPMEAWSPNDVSTGVAVLARIAHGIESLKCTDVEPAFHRSRPPVGIAGYVGSIGWKSLNFGSASGLSHVNAIVDGEGRPAAEIGDTIELPTGQ